ncbi:MAG: DUF805 domain-containing protein [Acidaminococcaceae bacterium]
MSISTDLFQQNLKYRLENPYSNENQLWGDDAVSDQWNKYPGQPIAPVAKNTTEGMFLQYLPEISIAVFILVLIIAFIYFRKNRQLLKTLVTNGRCNRKTFAIGFFIFNGLALSFLLLIFTFNTSLFIDFAKFTFIATLLFNATLYGVRFHDLGAPSWLGFLLVICGSISNFSGISIFSLISTIAFFVLFFTKGTSGTNKYGEDPLVKTI